MALKSKLRDSIVTKSAYSAMKLIDKFKIKTKTVKEHQHGIKYYVEYPKENYNGNYFGETGRRLLPRFIVHNGWDKNSHIFKHSVGSENRPDILQKFSILGGNYRKNKFRIKVAGSLIIKEKRATLNKRN